MSRFHKLSHTLWLGTLTPWRTVPVFSGLFLKRELSEVLAKSVQKIYEKDVFPSFVPIGVSAVLSNSKV